MSIKTSSLLSILIFAAVLAQGLTLRQSSNKTANTTTTAKSTATNMGSILVNFGSFCGPKTK
jgi:hypothetical protein